MSTESTAQAFAHETALLPSRETRTDYHLFIRRAAAVDVAPLLLVLDGDDQFEPFAEAAAQLSGEKTIPALHVVGIGYGGSYRSPKNRRARDYTPTREPSEPSETGGADAFLRFITRELLPFLSERLGFDQNETALTGHSLGSLFGLYSLVTYDSPFKRYLISSPSIWWHDRSVLRFVAEARKPATPRRAFFSVGLLDTDSMRRDLELLGKQLQAKPLPNVDVVFRSIPDRDHYNVIPDAARAGLSWLFSRANPVSRSE